ncbi:endoplasmic reticulum-based factor for assembly of V-ATPase-domain-containing protein [Aspergillus cavernicola]|uniref:Endoplasmic reticulum-based factor for assembly of V-ATPase-domain-containing protein n=1 Tax=Aspergillus cavernicola TaxID=176166 RepID=A0ABR4HN78_9EURO
MVRLATTTPILSAFEAIPPSTREDLNLPDSLTLGNPISHDQVIRISHYFRDKRNPQNANADADADSNVHRSLDSLLRGMKLYIPPPPPKPEPTPEYLALKARLLAAAESDAYNRMLSPQLDHLTGGGGVFTSSTPALSALHDTNPSTMDPDYKDPLTPSLVLNIFLSVLITGFSVYWALTTFQTPEILVSMISSTWSGQRPTLQQQNQSRGVGVGASEPVRVLLSLFAALGVGIAEVLIYAIYLGKIEQAREKEGRVKERKEVVSEEVIARSDSLPVEKGQAGEDGKDKEVIWGRGPNGGLRRRMREKWEEEKDKDLDQGG